MNKKQIEIVIKTFLTDHAYYLKMATSCKFESNKQYWLGKADGCLKAANDLEFAAAYCGK